MTSAASGQMMDRACSLALHAREAHAGGVWMTRVEAEVKI